jgi:hypothetical protein
MSPMATTMVAGATVIASGRPAAARVRAAADGGAAAILALGMVLALGMAHLPYPAVPTAAVAVGLMVGADTTSVGCVFPSDSAG